MGIEIISLTPKGDAVSHSVRQTNAPEWRLINYLRKMGGRSTRDRIVSFVYNGDVGTTQTVIRTLKYKGIVTGE